MSSRDNAPRRPSLLRPISFLQARAAEGGPPKRSGSQKLLLRFLYDGLNWLLNGSGDAFMNYGYAPSRDAGDPLNLPPEDEPNRYGVQLYDQVVQPMTLSGLTVLEVGCGRGGGAAFVFERHRPARMIGLDLAGRAIAHCRRTHRRSGLHFVRGDAEQLPFPDASFDAVLSVESSHCYPDVPRFLSEVVRVLRPYGLLLFADLRYVGANGSDDARRTPDLAQLSHQIAASGLVVLEEEDITANVIRALELDTPRRRALIEGRAPRPLRRQLLELAGVAGSSIHHAFRNGEIGYVREVLQRRPPASETRPEPVSASAP